MRLVSFLLLALSVSFVPVVGAQQPLNRAPNGRHPLHRMANQTAEAANLTESQIFSAHTNPGDAANIWELGIYPGGTWAALGEINDSGVLVGLGDVPPIGPSGFGYTHTLLVPLFGPNAGEWLDLGALGGEQSSAGWEEPFPVQISNTGLVTSHSVASDGQVHAVAWTKATGMVDLGTLADTGEQEFANYNSSYGAATNRLGTLMVGWSGANGNADAPVVWTSSKAWKNGEFVTKWKVQKLDTTGYPNLTGWQAWGVNDYGQIIGIAFDTEFTVSVSTLWNPRHDGKGWELTMLPPSTDYPYTFAFRINDMGYIAGAFMSGDGSLWRPRLWKPLDADRAKYSAAIELPLPKGYIGCEAVGINEIGDVTGDCYNKKVDVAARWTIKDLTFSEILNFPGSSSSAWGVNNNRTAAVFYVGDKACPADTYGSCGGAIQIH